MLLSLLIQGNYLEWSRIELPQMLNWRVNVLVIFKIT
jgi:hypothetical protein